MDLNIDLHHLILTYRSTNTVANDFVRILVKIEIKIGQN